MKVNQRNKIKQWQATQEEIDSGILVPLDEATIIWWMDRTIIKSECPVRISFSDEELRVGPHWDYFCKLSAREQQDVLSGKARNVPGKGML